MFEERIGDSVGVKFKILEEVVAGVTVELMLCVTDIVGYETIMFGLEVSLWLSDSPFSQFSNFSVLGILLNGWKLKVEGLDVFGHSPGSCCHILSEPYNDILNIKISIKMSY